VVDASDPDPEGQIAAVRTVLGEIGATQVPELLVLNKADAADEAAILALRANHPDALVVSARTGRGFDELRAVVDERLPRPEIPLTVLVPYGRGDLVDKVHKTAVIDSLEHTGEGTLITARVRGDLADELAAFVRE
jgi:GTP-binding protein HflX